MRVPQVLRVTDINPNVESLRKDGRWLPARPLPYIKTVNLLVRLKLAWHVFTGRYDAFDWEDQDG